VASVNDIWSRRFIELGEKFVDWFIAGKFDLDQIVKFPSHLHVLSELYNILARQGKLTRIEKLDLEDKNAIWDACKPYIETLSTPDRIRFCKCYWALTCLAEKRNL
jgi:hypothetical protein